MIVYLIKNEKIIEWIDLLYFIDSWRKLILTTKCITNATTIKVEKWKVWSTLHILHLYKKYEDHPVRSYELGDNDESLPFLKEMKEVLILNNFIHPVIEKYGEKNNLMYHLLE